MAKTNKKERYAILANKSYGLYAGIVESFDALQADPFDAIARLKLGASIGVEDAQ